jgi:hypothetical protein
MGQHEAGCCYGTDAVWAEVNSVERFPGFEHGVRSLAWRPQIGYQLVAASGVGVEALGAAGQGRG